MVWYQEEGRKYQTKSHTYKKGFGECTKSDKKSGVAHEQH